MKEREARQLREEKHALRERAAASEGKLARALSPILCSACRRMPCACQLAALTKIFQQHARALPSAQKDRAM